MMQINVINQLPAPTTVHWHGIRLRQQADGVPGVTQDPIAPAASYRYEFTVPDAGTYFYHPHVGVQLDRGLYAPLIVDDPAEPGAYDHEWVVMLDDWIDGTGTTPDDVLKKLIADGAAASSGSMGGMGGRDHGNMGGMSMGAPPWGDAGDVAYPHHLINGKTSAAPSTLSAKPGQRVRIRLINAASDTIFTVALGGHRMTVTHADGYPVQPTDAAALYLGMGERYDVTVTLADGVFPLVAKPFGKTSGGQGLALIRTATGAAPGADIAPRELSGPVLVGAQLKPAESAKFPDAAIAAELALTLTGSMKPYQWAINGAAYPHNTPLAVREGKRMRIHARNMSMMTHPLHIHGHTFALPSGLRKDTVLLAPMQSLAIDLQADNPGNWMAHCHNAYHGEAGMMIELRYLK